MFWNIFGISFCALLIALDQFTKYLAKEYLSSPYVIIKNILEFNYTTNMGMAFGMLQGGFWFLVPVTIVILIGLIIYYIKIENAKHTIWLRLSLVLISAGAVGNLIDRVKNKYVVDFIYFKLIDFPVFNVADMCVVCGTFLLAFYIVFLTESKEKGVL